MTIALLDWLILTKSSYVLYLKKKLERSNMFLKRVNLTYSKYYLEETQSDCRRQNLFNNMFRSPVVNVEYMINLRVSPKWHTTLLKPQAVQKRTQLSLTANFSRSTHHTYIFPHPCKEQVITI